MDSKKSTARLTGNDLQPSGCLVLMEFSENMKKFIQALSQSENAQCELIPHEMSVLTFETEIPDGLSPVKLDTTQSKKLLSLIHVYNDAIFAVAKNISQYDDNNYAEIEFPHITFHFHFVARTDLSALHDLMLLWKKKGVDIVTVSVRNFSVNGVLSLVKDESK